MVLAEMAEKAVAEMGRLWQEAAAKKLLPPIAADRRLAMEMAPRIIFGGGWCRRKDMHALAANANETMGRGENEEQSDGQTKKKTQHKKHIILHDAPRRMPALRLIFANSNDDVETKQRGSMLPCTAGSYCQCGSSMQRLSVSPPAAIHHTSSSSPDLAAAAVAVGHGW